MMSIIDELEVIRKRDPAGVLYPEKVVEFARDSTTELHSKFDWNDRTAADSYRLEQARSIIRVSVRVIDHDDEDVSVRAYVAINKDRHGYEDTRVVLTKPKKRHELIASILERFESTLENHQPLHELDGIRKAVESCRRGLSSSKSPSPKPKAPKGGGADATV